MNPGTWGDRWREMMGRDDDIDRARHSTEHAPPDEVDTDGPPEPPEGQDPRDPDLNLAIRAAFYLLDDVHVRLAREDDHDARDLRLRVAALRSAIQRILDERGDDDGRR